MASLEEATRCRSPPGEAGVTPAAEASSKFTQRSGETGEQTDDVVIVDQSIGHIDQGDHTLVARHSETPP
jgi:hypothetical protein